MELGLEEVVDVDVGEGGWNVQYAVESLASPFPFPFSPSAFLVLLVHQRAEFSFSSFSFPLSLSFPLRPRSACTIARADAEQN